MIASTPSVPNCRSFQQIQIHSVYYVYRQCISRCIEKSIYLDLPNNLQFGTEGVFNKKQKIQHIEIIYVFIFLDLFLNICKIIFIQIIKVQGSVTHHLLQKSSQCKQRKRRQITDHVVLIFLVGLNNWKTNWTHPLDWLVY